MDDPTDLVYAVSMVSSGRPSGFSHETMVILSRRTVALLEADPVTRRLFPTDVGRFPRAEGHFRARPAGSPQGILLICLDGAGTVWAAPGPEEPVSGGAVVYIPPGVPHWYRADPKVPWSLLWVHVAGSDTAEVLPRQPGVWPLASARGRLESVFDDLVTLARTATPGAGLRALAAALGWVVALAGERLDLPSPGLGAAPAVDRALAFARSHLDLPLSVADLARASGLSASRLTALFRRQTGSSPLAYFVRLRLETARGLLERTALGIGEVAARVGYEDPLYFSRVFRKAFGASPRAWRANPPG